MPQPTYLPIGYSKRITHKNRPVGAFERYVDNTVTSYTRGHAISEMARPLLVIEGPRDAPALEGTSGCRGVLLHAFSSEVTFEYHDGWWELGRGANEQELVSGIYVHWAAERVHSITVRTPDYVVAVRGSREAGVGFAELVKVARSASAGA